MAGPDVYVVRTGVANLASVLAGFRRLGANPIITEDPAAVREASHVMLPGVGAFGSAMERLDALKLSDPLRERFANDLPTIAICVGLQVLCNTSEESPGATGLGVVPLHVRRFPNTVRVPHFGWNEVVPEPGTRILEKGYAYFANSYHAEKAPPGWFSAQAVHGSPFTAAFERGNCVALQFHPELSGPFGEGILRRWLEGSDCQC